MIYLECWDADENLGLIAVHDATIETMEILWKRWYQKRVEEDGGLDVEQFCEWVSGEEGITAERVYIERINA